ncbi:MAG: hypothetical protein RMJ53_05500 [Chitinophagales bacterium]|nr:hypothetical protein [Chitinophagales bacterium]
MSKCKYIPLLITTMLLTSCGKMPYACFTVSEKEDSVPVNKPVIFNAYCSDNAKEYFWSFPNDSVAYTAIVTYTFREIGKKKVSLMVGNGNKSRYSFKELNVVP